jgi:Motility quorum-sensing regulator, toxin of MqsA
MTLPPIYDLADVLTLVAADAWVFATRKCRDDVMSLGMTRKDVANVLLQLPDGRFRKPYGPCNTDFGVFSGDDYLLWVDDITFVSCAPGAGKRLYIKFAIRSTPAGEDCLLISFHESGR